MSRIKIAFLLSMVLLFASKQALTAESFHSHADSLAEEAYFSQKSDSASQTLTLVFAGDIMGHDPQISGAFNESDSTYNYEPTFRYITNYISAADIAIANLEVTLAGAPYTGYPQFSSPDALAAAAHAAGFDVMVTANNHALDRGARGLVRTLIVLDSLGLKHTGTFMNPADRASRYPLMLTKNGFRIAVLNYTYGTNGIVVKPPYSVNRIDTAQIRKDIEKSVSDSAEYILCLMHWGLEYERAENAEQRRLAQFIFSCGADAIIGSHPHVVQPIRMERYTEIDSLVDYPVVYSMGNFVSNQRAQYKDGGIMAEMHLSRQDGKVKLDSLLYLPYWVYREEVGAEKFTFYVIPVSLIEKHPETTHLNNDDLDRLNRFKSDTRNHLLEARESNFYK